MGCYRPATHRSFQRATAHGFHGRHRPRISTRRRRPRACTSALAPISTPPPKRTRVPNGNATAAFPHADSARKMKSGERLRRRGRFSDAAEHRPIAPRTICYPAILVTSFAVIILCQSLPEFARLRPYDVILSRVERSGASQSFHADRLLLQFPASAHQRGLHRVAQYPPQRIRGPEYGARQNAAEMVAHRVA